jgi:hypothetical protein
VTSIDVAMVHSVLFFLFFAVLGTCKLNS